jgi:HSP20 family molecular chaperone IbpA
MRVEEFSRNGDFIIRAELPGIDPEKDVEITVSDGMLTIEGKREESHEAGHRSEFYYGRFMRTLSLPAGAGEENVKASYRDGILEVLIPLKSPTEVTHKVPIARAA